MTISCCLMCRDNEATIGKALESVRRLADEIVVVDTGSTDGTLAIARDWADVLLERPWPDDFSKARNWTLEAASGDWILILDSDESLKDEDVWRRKLPPLLGEHLGALDVRVVNLIGQTGDPDLIDQFWQTRLFPNVPEIRYEGVVHNQLARSVRAYCNESGRHWLQSPLVIYHTGYDLTDEARTAKYTRRLPLYRKALADAADEQTRNYYAYQLGVGLFLAGAFDEAWRQLVEDVRYELLMEEQQMHGLTVALKAAVAILLSGFSLEEERALGIASHLVEHHANPEALICVSNLCMLLGRRRDGLRALLLAYERADQDEYRQVPHARIATAIVELMEQVGQQQAARAFAACTLEQKLGMARYMRAELTRMTAAEAS